MARAKGAIISNWLDAYDWRIDEVLTAWDGNITTASYDLSNDLKRGDKEVNQKTLRSQISRWLKRREELKWLCNLNGIENTKDCTVMVELLQAKQKNGSLIK